MTFKKRIDSVVYSIDNDNYEISVGIEEEEISMPEYWPLDKEVLNELIEVLQDIIKEL